MKQFALLAGGLVWAFSTLSLEPSYSQAFDVVTLRSPHKSNRATAFGSHVSGVGDANQDGFADVIVAVGDDGPHGRAYVFSGKDRAVLFALRSPYQEESGSDQFGVSVAAAGDVDRDGYADMFVGSPTDSPPGSPDEAGRAYVFSGRNGTVLLELVSPEQVPFGFFGSSVAGAGDVNKDGVPDLLVGATREGPVSGGLAYLVSGRDGQVLFKFASANNGPFGNFGGSISSAGDVNQDSFLDVIVGASHEISNPARAGRAYIFSGRNGTQLFELVSPNQQRDGYFGRSVAGVGDANADGSADVVVGAEGENPGMSPIGAGRAYVLSGLDGSPLFELASPNEETFGFFGKSVAHVGDVNQDGSPDVVVGAGGEIKGRVDSVGRAYVISGRDGALLHQLETPNPNYENGGYFGDSVAQAGDFNDDGLPDLIVGAYLERPLDGRGDENEGHAYVFKPTDTQLPN